MLLMVSIMNIMFKSMNTMDTDTAIIEETRVILAKNKDTWILVGLDKQLIHIMEEDGPTALAMESNPY